MRLPCAALLLAPLACASGAEAQSFDAAALLALHHRYVGWRFGDGTLNSLREEGTETRRHHGKTDVVANEIVLRRGALYREDVLDLKTDATRSTGFTGNIFWGSDENGFTHPILGDAAKYQISLSFVFNEATTELAGTLEQPRTLGGVQYQVVRVAPASGFPIDLYVEPATGAYRRVVIDPGGAYQSTFDKVTYAQFVPNKRIISGYSSRSGEFAVTFTKFTANLPVTAEQLHPPQQTATWAFGDPQPFPIRITHFRVLVDASVNGVNGTFILDTGADGVYLDRGFAARAHVRDLHEDNLAFGLYNDDPFKTGMVDALTIGGNTLSHLIVRELSFTSYDYRGLDGGGYAGLLGYDLFGGAAVTLRFSNSTMAISDPAVDLDSEKGLHVALDLSEQIPALPMIVDDTFPVDAMLDTGNPGLIFLSPDLTHKPHFPQRIYGCGHIQKLSLATISYLSEGACEAGLLSGRQLLVGFDFLKHFDIVFDYPRGQMILEPLPH